MGGSFCPECGRQITRVCNGGSAFWCPTCKVLSPVDSSISEKEAMRKKRKKKKDVAPAVEVPKDEPVVKRKPTLTRGDEV